METVLASCVHPDTKEPIWWPMRVSAAIPTNLPIIAGMLLTAPTPANIFFWQWANQTYNAGLNYGNRNASIETDLKKTLTSYTIAVTSAVIVALGLKRSFAPLIRGREGTLAGSLLQNMTSFGAVAITSSLNMALVRSAELKTGIEVKTEDG